MDDERRKFTRFPFAMNTELVCGETVYKADKIINLSVGGCLLPIKAELKPGVSCTIRIILGDNSNGTIVTVEGKIVRSDQGNIAVEFTSVDPENLHHLQKIALYNSPDSAKIEKEIHEHPGLK